jgi:hypothetical protein
MANFVYNQAKQSILEGDIDVTNNTLKLLLVTSSYSPDEDNDQFVNDISAPAIVHRSAALQNVTNIFGVLDAHDIIIADFPGTAFSSIIIYVDTGNDATSRLLAYIDESSGIPFAGVPSPTPITIVWNNGATKIIALTDADARITNTVLYGSVTPPNSLGIDGDFYINTSNNYIYGPKIYGAWPAGTSLVGPAAAAANLDDLSNVNAATPSTNDFLKWNGSSWINDDIDLGTDTSGNYVQNLTAGTNVTLSNNSGEGATPTITVIGNLDLIDSISTPNYIQFDPSYSATPNVGMVQWDATNGTLQLGLYGGNVDLQVGQESVAYVFNAEANTLSRGEVVYIFGAQGDRVSVKRADNRYENTSSKVLGVVAEGITSSQYGFVTTYGQLGKLALGSPYVSGDLLWLGHSGAFTRTKPSAPENLVFIGVVERANNGNGTAFINPQNGHELEELHNVSINNPQNASIISYQTSSGLWKQATLALGSNPAILITQTNYNLLSPPDANTVYIIID